MEPDSIQEKQKYLRENILQSGFDPSDFVAFLEHNENIDHIDIEGWSMNKIQQLVGAYKQYKYYLTKQQGSSQKKKIFSDRQRKTQTGQQHQGKDKKKGSDKDIMSVATLSLEGGKMVYEKEKMNQYQEKNSKIQYPKNAPLFDYEFKAKCKCTKAENLIVDGLKVEVPSFEALESAGLFLGFGAKTEIWFTIKSNIKKHTSVKRVLQDFDWFSATLIRLYPYLALPELSQYRKQLQNPNERRRLQIQEYLQCLAVRQELYTSTLFYEFLTIHQDKLQKFKKMYDNMGFTKGVAQLKTLSGQIQVEYTKKLREFEESCHQYSRTVLPVHEKFSVCLQKTIESIQVVVSNINYLVDYFAELHQNYNQLMNKFPEQKSSQYNQILVNMNNLFLGLSQNCKSHALNLEKHLKQYFKTNVINDKNIIRLEKYVKDEQRMYLEYKYNLMRKKERLIGQVEKWDIDVKGLGENTISELKSKKQKAYEVMLPRETQQENQIKAWVAFLYTNFAQQFNKYIKESTWRYAKNYKLFVTDLLSKDKNYLEQLTKFLTESRKLVK